MEGADVKSKPQIGTADGRKVYTQEEADNGWREDTNKVMCALARPNRHQHQPQYGLVSNHPRADFEPFAFYYYRTTLPESSARSSLPKNFVSLPHTS